VKGDPIRLQDFSEDMTGTISLNGFIKGPAAGPRGELTLQARALHVAGQKIDAISLSSHFDRDRFWVEQLMVHPVADEQIRVEGWVSRDKSYGLKIATSNTDLSHIHGLQEVLPLQGILSFDFQGEGRLEDPHMEGVAGFRKLRLNGKDLEDLVCNISVKEKEAKVFVDGDVALEAQLQLDTNDFSLAARFEQADLAPYFQLVHMSGMQGVLTGKAHVAGNVKSWRTMQGEVDFSQLDLYSGKTPLARGRALQASFRDHELQILPFHLDLAQTGHLTVEGKGKVDGPLDFKIDGRIPMQIIQAFTRHIDEATGSMALSATMQGHTSEPRINIVGEFNNMGFLVPAMAQRLQKIEGKMRATHKAVVLDNCRGNWDTGLFAVSGSIGLEQFQPSEMNLEAQVSKFPVRLPNTLDIIVDGDLKMQGNADASTVQGKVTMLEGTYYKDVDLSLITGSEYERRRPLPVQRNITEPFLRNMALDVVITHRKPFLVDNNLALLTVKPDLRLYGTLQNPLMSGRAEVESGMITYRKEDFKVTQGVFDFVNPYRIEPTIAVKGEMKIRRWMIFLEVTGVPDNLKFIFTSNPSETTEDIVSLLALGKTTGELIGDDSGSSFSTTEMFSSVLGDAMGEELKNATGLDEVKIGYTEGTGSDEEGGMHVTLGKKLSRRTTVKYGVETKGAKRIERVDVGYKLRENLSVSSFQNTEGQFGGELLYRLEFR
jgi:autotransporter translocation and assembly factor TamB